MNRLAKMPAGGGGAGNGSKQTTGYPRTLLENKLNERYFELESKLKKDVQGRYHIVYPHPLTNHLIHSLIHPLTNHPIHPLLSHTFSSYTLFAHTS